MNKKLMICTLIATLGLSGCQSKQKTENSEEQSSIKEVLEEKEKTQEEEETKPQVEEKEEESIEETQEEEPSREDSNDSHTATSENTTPSSAESGADTPQNSTVQQPASQSDNSTAASTPSAPSASTPASGNFVTIGNTNRAVIIDAGHGGSDSGCLANGLQEKDITLTYALAVGSYLQSKGITVYYTRTADYELARSSYSYNGSTLTNDLTARSALGASYNAAIYCSFHIDSASSSAHGFSCFFNPKYDDSYDAANIMLSHLSSIGYTVNRGLLDGTRLRSIRGNSTIAIMVELGFIQSSDITYLLNNVSTVAAACGDALIEKLNKGWLHPEQQIIPDLADY